MALDSLRARDLTGVKFVGTAFAWTDLIAVWGELAEGVEDPEIYKSAPSDAWVESTMDVIERFGDIGLGPWARTLLMPPDAWGLAASRRLAHGSDSAMAEVGHHRVGLMWAARGAWDSAAVAMQQYADWSRDPGAPVNAYRMAVYGVWLGALDVEVARAARVAVTAAETNLADRLAAEVPFLDGVLAASQQDHSALQRALQELDGLEPSDAERFRGAFKIAWVIQDGFRRQAIADFRSAITGRPSCLRASLEDRPSCLRASLEDRVRFCRARVSSSETPS